MNIFPNRVYILTIIIFANTLAAESVFTVFPTPQLQVKLKNQDFITADRFLGPEENFPDGKRESFKVEGWLNVNRISGNSSQMKYVKETGLQKDKLELNVWAQTNPGSGNPFFYEFKVPVEFLKGYPCKITTGVIFGQTRKYTCNGTEPDGKELAVNLRFLEIDRGQKSVAIDFNPAGVWNVNQGSTSGNCETRWRMKRQGKYYIFSAKKIGRNNLGHIFLMKVVFYNGLQNYSTIHPVSDNYYIRPMFKSLFINFGNKPCWGAMAFGIQGYSEQRRYGWLNKGLSMVSTKFSDPLKKEYITGNQPGLFKIKTIPGRYILVVQFGDIKKPIGPFDVWINCIKSTSSLSSDSGQFRSAALKATTDKNGLLQIKFNGRWAINSLMLQPYLFMTEDYLFDRDWWIVRTGLPELAKVKRNN